MRNRYAHYQKNPATNPKTGRPYTLNDDIEMYHDDIMPKLRSLDVQMSEDDSRREELLPDWARSGENNSPL